MVIVTGPDSPIRDRNEEFISLVLSTGSVISGITYINVRTYNRNTLIGKGKIDELKKTISKEVKFANGHVSIFKSKVDDNSAGNFIKMELKTFFVSLQLFHYPGFEIIHNIGQRISSFTLNLLQSTLARSNIPYGGKDKG